VTWVSAAAGRDVAVLAAALESGLYVSTSHSGGGWTDPSLISSSPLDLFHRPLVRVARDDGAAIVLWPEEDDRVLFSMWTNEGGFGSPVVVDGARGLTFADIDAVMLPQGTALVAWGGGSGVHVVGTDGQVTIDDAAPVGLHRRLFLGAGERAVLYVTPSLGDSTRYEYDPTTGAESPESVPPMNSAGSAWQSFWFENVTGGGARIVRRWAAPETEGLHVTVRRGEQDWSDEERVTNDDSDSIDAPAVTAVSDELLLYWQGTAGVVERSYETAWGDERTLARSRDVEIRGVAGSQDGAALVGTLEGEQGSLTKLFRRGADGTWYCPRLARHGSNPAVTSTPDGELIFFGSRDGSGRLVRFRP
jgi:hypothetical protein